MLPAGPAATAAAAAVVDDIMLASPAAPAATLAGWERPANWLKAIRDAPPAPKIEPAWAATNQATEYGKPPRTAKKCTCSGNVRRHIACNLRDAPFPTRAVTGICNCRQLQDVRIKAR
jgi:hypothetical protein